jgi:hypothetical protein
MTVAVEIARVDGVPVGAGVAETGAGDHAGAIQFPDGDLAGAVLPQDVGKPSPLKSPVATRCQSGPGLPRLALAITLVPFNFQTATSPVEFCHRMSDRPSPLKSPDAIACQLGPGLPRLPPAMTLVPSSSQMSTSPLSFCHRMPERPLP